MTRPEIRELAGAMRRHTRRTVRRHGTARVEGVVLAVAPLLVDVAGMDAQLDDDDVTIGNALAAHLADVPLEVGDTLVLVEADDGDYDAVDVLRD